MAFAVVIVVVLVKYFITVTLTTVVFPAIESIVDDASLYDRTYFTYFSSNCKIFFITNCNFDFVTIWSEVFIYSIYSNIYVTDGRDVVFFFSNYCSFILHYQNHSLQSTLIGQKMPS